MMMEMSKQFIHDQRSAFLAGKRAAWTLLNAILECG